MIGRTKNNAGLARKVKSLGGEKLGAAGFTLVELMIVVVIIGIITAIAYPAYQDHVRKSRRADGKAALQGLATRLEQYYLDNKQYTNSLANLGYTAVGGNFYSPEQYYALAVTTSTVACPAETCYSISAAAQAKGRQNKDTTCSPLTFDNRGNKGPTGCW